MVQEGSRAVLQYLTSKIDGMLHKNERTHPPPSMAKETFVIDEENNFKRMTIFNMFKLYFQRRLEKYKEKNGGSEEQALQSWKLAIQTLLHNYAEEEHNSWTDEYTVISNKPSLSALHLERGSYSFRSTTAGQMNTQSSQMSLLFPLSISNGAPIPSGAQQLDR